MTNQKIAKSILISNGNFVGTKKMLEDNESLNKFWTLLCKKGFVDIEHSYDEDKLMIVRFDIDCNTCVGCKHITRFNRYMSGGYYWLNFCDIDMTKVQKVEDLFKNIDRDEKQCCHSLQTKVEESLITKLHALIRETYPLHEFSASTHERAKEYARQNIQRHHSYCCNDDCDQLLRACYDWPDCNKDQKCYKCKMKKNLVGWNDIIFEEIQ